jgi:replication protein
MSNEIVKYHNDLNTVVMRGWTAEEMNFFFAIIAKVRNEGTKQFTFNKAQLIELADYKIEHKKRFYDTFESLASNVMKLRYVEKTENSFDFMTLFTRFKLEWSDDLSDMKALVKVSEEFEYIVNELSGKFTMYELAEFTRIRSTYAKTMYRLLKQWRTVGKREFKVEEFKALLDTPKSYKTSELDRAVVKPILKQLSPFFKDLKVKKVKGRGKGTPVLAYTFTWEAEEKRLRKNADVINSDNLPEITDLDSFFNQVGSVSADYRTAIASKIESFEPAEVLKMLKFAEDLRKRKETPTSFGYTVTVISEWADNGVKTYDEAVDFYNTNYNQQPEQQAPKAKKGGKKQVPESNVPKWSNPDYENPLDPKIIDMLIEFHRSQGTLETPKAKAEIAQRKKEIEEGRANLEAQKQALLARLDKKQNEK